MTSQPDRSGAFGRIVRAGFRAQWGALAWAALGLVGLVAAELLAPWPLKLIFDQVLLGRPLPPGQAWLAPWLAHDTVTVLGLLAAAIAGIALVAGACAYLQMHHSAQVGHHLTWRLRGELFAHLQRLSLAHHQQHRAGELLTKVVSDTQLLRELFSDGLLTLVRQSLTLVAMLAVMLWLDWRLALVVVTTLPPLLAVIFWLNREVKSQVRAQRRHEGRMAARLNEMLQSITLVQAFGRERAEEERFRRDITDSLTSGMRSTRAAAAISRSIVVIGAVGTAITVLVGAHRVLAGALSPGELLIFMAYVTSLYKPVKDLGRLSAKFTRAAVSMQRVSELLALRPDIEDAPDAIDLKQPAGEIVFEDVCFAYPGGPLVLDRLNLRIAAGERVALVGRSGTGKSTLLTLLLRLAEPTAGRILIDGTDIRQYTRASLRSEIGIVLQDHLLLAVSVRENIAYGRPDAPPAEIEAAARAARAHDFITELPKGYDTVLSERAASLSGGQRQRLNLARALVKQPAILVMDEPTASVDAVSARLIHEAVGQVHRGRTLLVIAHDYADMARYDRVLVLQHGRLVEQGPHDALLRRGGAYLALVERRSA